MYLKQNKYRKAEYHFRKAIEINPSNAVLIGAQANVRVDSFCDVPLSLEASPQSALHGKLTQVLRVPATQVLDKQGKRDEALALFDRALKLSPKNYQLVYLRAFLLLGLKRYEVGSIFLFCFVFGRSVPKGRRMDWRFRGDRSRRPDCSRLR